MTCDYIVSRVLSQFCPEKRVRISDSIFIEPGGSRLWDFSHGNTSQVSMNANFFWYVEKRPRGLERRVGASYSTLDNLKDFIVFWAMLLQDHFAVKGFETGIGEVQILASTPDLVNDFSPVNKSFLISSTSAIISDWPSSFDLAMSFEVAFSKFCGADERIKDCCRLLVSRWARCGHNDNLKIYNNYLQDISTLYYIIDALLPEDRCSGTVSCSDCKVTGLRHAPGNTRKLKIKDLLRGFADADLLTDLVMKVGDKRHIFVHEAKSELEPLAILPTKKNADGRTERSVSMQEGVANFGTEGLATHQARIILESVVRALLLNRIFPTASFYPASRDLKLFMVGGGA